MTKKVTVLPIITEAVTASFDNPAAYGGEGPVTTTIQLGTLSGEVYQLPLSAKGLKELIKVIGSLDEARAALGIPPSDDERRMQ
jgi:hypothetical protein